MIKYRTDRLSRTSRHSAKRGGGPHSGAARGLRSLSDPERSAVEKIVVNTYIIADIIPLFATSGEMSLMLFYV